MRKDNRVDVEWILPEINVQVINLYCCGLSEGEIMAVVGIGLNEIKEILDTYTKYL